MVDLELLRSSPELFRVSLKNRFMPEHFLTEALKADGDWRSLTARADALRSERNQLASTPQTAQAHHRRLKEIKRDLDHLTEKMKVVGERRDALIARLPNLLADEVPVGEGESANKPVKTVGKIGSKEGQGHEELMTKLGWLDQLKAAQVSGARFRYLTGDAALAWLKLSRLAIEFGVEHSFRPVIPPVLLRSDVLEKAGFFPEGEADTFKTDDLYLAGTSEYALVGEYLESVLEEDQLPVRLIGFSTCFRREAGSYGKDTRGMFRQHQFDKVEMVSICAPKDSAKEHEFLLGMQEKFVKKFNIPYQVVLIGSGDVEKKAVKRYDLETWFPGQKNYRETHSVSNCTDYQARGLSIKFRSSDGSTAFAHTLNGTLVTERLLLAIIENGQHPTGEVTLPTELRA